MITAAVGPALALGGPTLQPMASQRGTSPSSRTWSALFNVSNTVILCGLDTSLLHHCKTNKVSDETITDINVKTLAYIKRCKRMKSSRNIQMTKKYLKEGRLPFQNGQDHSASSIWKTGKTPKERKTPGVASCNTMLPPTTPCYLLQHLTASCNTILPPATPCCHQQNNQH